MGALIRELRAGRPAASAAGRSSAPPSASSRAANGDQTTLANEALRRTVLTFVQAPGLVEFRPVAVGHWRWVEYGLPEPRTHTTARPPAAKIGPTTTVPAMAVEGLVPACLRRTVRYSAGVSGGQRTGGRHRHPREMRAGAPGRASAAARSRTSGPTAPQQRRPGAARPSASRRQAAGVSSGPFQAEAVGA